MDYSKLSDYEINCEVGRSICFSDYLLARNEQKNYCSNPADAWPIIQENGISVVRDYDEWVALAGVESRHGEADHFSHCYQKAPDKPLRAAMIVYLMMQEGESE